MDEHEAAQAWARDVFWAQKQQEALVHTVHRLLAEIVKRGDRDGGLYGYSQQLVDRLLTDPFAKGQLRALLCESQDAASTG